jgi:tRNA pseudouridine55 synthase
MIDGILIINKQKDITSYDVIRKLKKYLPEGQKIGHAGSLDPFATGVLIILLGKATKKMQSILDLRKVYRVKAQLGYSTDTQDITGEILEKGEINNDVDIEDLIEEKFIGKILQTPPQYSAKKINGKKAYELARKKISFELKPKEIEVYRFEVLSHNEDILEFEIECSSGTYIRTLVHDLGKLIGSYATAIELTRTSIGSFSIEDAINSQDINEDVVSSIIYDYE